MSIWIVEYAYEGIGEADAFSSAWTTAEKAQEDAKKQADAQKADMVEGGLQDEELEVKIVLCNEDKRYQVGVHYVNGDICDWWTVREVPLD